MRYLTVALAKGRLAELAMELFISIGMDCSEMKEKTRKLIFTDEKNKMKFILVKASYPLKAFLLYSISSF